MGLNDACPRVLTTDSVVFRTALEIVAEQKDEY